MLHYTTVWSGFPKYACYIAIITRIVHFQQLKCTFLTLQALAGAEAAFLPDQEKQEVVKAIRERLAALEHGHC